MPGAEGSRQTCQYGRDDGRRGGSEAERERRSKVISAEGEFQASQRLADAAKILSDQPSALTLRYLQTLREIATENNSTTIFPVPIDILKPFMNNGLKITTEEKP